MGMLGGNFYVGGRRGPVASPSESGVDDGTEVLVVLDAGAVVGGPLFWCLINPSHTVIHVSRRSTGNDASIRVVNVVTLVPASASDLTACKALAQLSITELIYET